MCVCFFYIAKFDGEILQITEFASFLYICTTHRKANHIGDDCVSLSLAQYKYIQNSQTLQGYIFRILHPFATKLCNFTNFKMLFLVLIKDFLYNARIKIYSVMGTVY